MPSTLIVPAQFMTPNSSGGFFNYPAQIVADSTTSPQKIVTRFPDGVISSAAFSWLVPPGITSATTGCLVWSTKASGSVVWKYTGAMAKSPWLVSHGSEIALPILSGNTEIYKIYRTPFLPLGLTSVTPMYLFSLELGRYASASGDTVPSDVDLLYFTWDFEDTFGARNSYIWVPMNGVYPSKGTPSIGYYDHNGIWFREFPSEDTSVDFQTILPTNFFDNATLYISYLSTFTESSGSSGLVEIYTSITNPCLDIDQDFVFAGSGYIHSGTGTTYIAIPLTADLQAGDQVTFRIKRAGDSIYDTASGSYRFYGFFLKYENSSFIQSEVLYFTNALGTAQSVLVPTVDGNSHQWVGRYLPTLNTYLDLPILSISPNYNNTPVLTVIWMTRDDLPGRIKLEVTIEHTGENNITYVSTQSKSVLVRGNYLEHKTVFSFLDLDLNFSPRDTYTVKVRRIGDNLADTFYGTVEGINVILDYIAKAS